jgi:hypothetical protein
MKMNMEQRWKCYQGKTEVLGEKPVPVPLYPPKPHMDWPGIETRSQGWEAGNQFTQNYFKVLVLTELLYLVSHKNLSVKSG